MDEFRLISDYFDRRRDASDIVVPIGDDGAVVSVGDKRVVQVLDSQVAGVHFPQDLPAADIGWRAVAVNLSDLAAMGATPRWMTLGLTLAQTDATWLTEFASGLFEAGDEFGIELVGGDTTRGTELVVTIAATGELPASSEPLLRSGAKVGDTIYVTGTLGDAAGGLRQYGNVASNDYLTQRFSRPQPRVAVGQSLLGIATAAIDISDGFAADLHKLLAASGVGGRVAIENLPLSQPLCEQFGQEECRDLALTGGDDYELCFTAAPDTEVAGATAVGSVTANAKLEFRLHGVPTAINTDGYRHFHD